MNSVSMISFSRWITIQAYVEPNLKITTRILPVIIQKIIPKFLFLESTKILERNDAKHV